MKRQSKNGSLAPCFAGSFVDPEENTLTYNGTLAISAEVINLELKINFKDDWGEYVKGEEWDDLVKLTCAGLEKKREQHIKGKGKDKLKGNIE